ncbi:unnamed protein product [Timema podura]|uniref:C2H2-type domain-containing protein n=1 Tax=Timema podura TaxID=61482 RepID=A0ABN7NGJ0_TIMPD|nr:unnamed protein product [Timema podura]
MEGKAQVHPTEIRTSFSLSSAVELNTTSALANYATEAGEKPFQCEECEYRTADHNSLRRHKMRHSGDKPYKCPHCAYACIQANTYKAHLKSKHPGLESSLMFSCWMCSFRSVKKENYLAHVANHETGAIPNRRVTHSPQASEAVPKKSAKESPVIIDLTSLHDVTGSSDSQEAFPDSNGVGEDGAENIELVYSSSSVVEELIQQAPSGVGKDGETFVVEMEPHSVIHLAQASSLLSSSNCQTLKSSASLDGMIMIPLSPEFEVEAEEITGDIRESQDLKFKTLPQEFKSLPQDLGFKACHKGGTIDIRDFKEPSPDIQIHKFKKCIEDCMLNPPDGVFSEGTYWRLTVIEIAEHQGRVLVCNNLETFFVSKVQGQEWGWGIAALPPVAIYFNTNHI